MPVNWPPPNGTYPTWPPPEFGSVWFSCSDWNTLLRALTDAGFTHSAPTGTESNAFFGNAVRCDDGHRVVGRMIVSPDGLRRYPFAVCNNSTDREFFVLWSPYTCGWKSGSVNF